MAREPRDQRRLSVSARLRQQFPLDSDVLGLAEHVFLVLLDVQEGILRDLDAVWHAALNGNAVVLAVGDGDGNEGAEVGDGSEVAEEVAADQP